MSKWLNELCPIILDMLQDASLIAKREVANIVNKKKLSLADFRNSMKYDCYFKFHYHVRLNCTVYIYVPVHKQTKM